MVRTHSTGAYRPTQGFQALRSVSGSRAGHLKNQIRSTTRACDHRTPSATTEQAGCGIVGSAGPARGVVPAQLRFCQSEGAPIFGRGSFGETPAGELRGGAMIRSALPNTRASQPHTVLQSRL